MYLRSVDRAIQIYTCEKEGTTTQKTNPKKDIGPERNREKKTGKETKKKEKGSFELI